MIRISATLLEQFRKLCEEEYVKEEDIIASVTGAHRPATWQMEAGTAWHSMLEADSVPDGFCYTHNDAEKGFSFTTEHVRRTKTLIGPGVYEVKLVHRLDILGTPVDLVCKADHVHGRVITDVKTRWGSQAHLADYERSLQWRAYLLAHECDVFRYIVCEFKEPSHGYCELKNVLQCRFYRYEAMANHVGEWVCNFLDWCQQRNLTEFLHRESRDPSVPEGATF